MCQTHSSNLTDHFVRYTSTVLGWTHILALSSRCQRTNQDSSDQLILYCPVVNCSLSFAFWIDRSGFLLLQLICLRVCDVVLISLKQSPYSPWTSGISKAFSPRGLPLNRLFFFQGVFSANSKYACAISISAITQSASHKSISSISFALDSSGSEHPAYLK